MQENRAEKIRAYVAANPDAKPAAIAEATGCKIQYVYSVTNKVKSPKKTKPKADAQIKGQEVLKTVLSKDAALIEKLVKENQEHQVAIFRMTAIISYLEKLVFKHGASV